MDYGMLWDDGNPTLFLYANRYGIAGWPDSLRGCRQLGLTGHNQFSFGFIYSVFCTNFFSTSDGEICQSDI